MKANPVTVVRNGRLINIEQDDLNQGDLVVVQGGEIVPADLRLVESKGLVVDEFELTGEIMPVVKTAEDQETMLYMGCRVIQGTGRGIVMATSEQTEYGEILKECEEPNQPDKLHVFKARYLILVALCWPAFIVDITQSTNRIFTGGIYLVLSAFLFLLQNNELIKFLYLSRQIRKHRRFGVQIRTAHSLQALGKVDVICFDKTGVLTTRQMAVKNIYGTEGSISPDSFYKENLNRLINLGCALCNDILVPEKIGQAHPIDQALLSFANKNGIDVAKTLHQANRFYHRSFDSENRYMACGFALNNGKTYYFAKGDPDVILKMCDGYMNTKGIKTKLDAKFLHQINTQIDEMSQLGNTLIALAYSPRMAELVPAGFTFLCLVQLENALQPGATNLIKQLTRRGIRSIMATGDRADTAIRISEQCGLTKNSKICLTGKMMVSMEFTEVFRQAAYCSVFARLLPSQKGILIRQLQQRGHSVAMIGDGPNDGIALKAADVDISFVNNSSPIARGLAQILINNLDDLLRLIEDAHTLSKISKYLKIVRFLLFILLFIVLYERMFA